MLLITTFDSLGRNSTLFSLSPVCCCCFFFILLLPVAVSFYRHKSEEKKANGLKLDCYTMITSVGLLFAMVYRIPYRFHGEKKTTQRMVKWHFVLIKIRFLWISLFDPFPYSRAQKVYAFRFIETRKKCTRTKERLQIFRFCPSDNNNWTV